MYDVCGRGEVVRAIGEGRDLRKDFSIIYIEVCRTAMGGASQTWRCSGWSCAFGEVSRAVSTLRTMCVDVVRWSGRSEKVEI